MKTKKYYFALGDVMRDLGVPNVNQLHVRYFVDILSRQALYGLCRRPRMIETDTVTKVCNAMGITPSDLWRAE